MIHGDFNNTLQTLCQGGLIYRKYAVQFILIEENTPQKGGNLRAKIVLPHFLAFNFLVCVLTFGVQREPQSAGTSLR